MQRPIDQRRLGRVWLERIVWNVAAAAALAVMIVVLLCSLQWLDQVDPQALRAQAEPEEGAALGSERLPEIRPPPLALGNGPRG
jgi:hypothetical protein